MEPTGPVALQIIQEPIAMDDGEEGVELVDELLVEGT